MLPKTDICRCISGSVLEEASSAGERKRVMIWRCWKDFRHSGPRNVLTLSSLVPIGADLWSLASRLGVAGVQKQPRSSDCSQGHASAALLLRNGQHVLQPLSHGGLGLSLSQQRVPSQTACCPFPSPTLPTLTVDVSADSSEVPPLASRLW